MIMIKNSTKKDMISDIERAQRNERIVMSGTDRLDEFRRMIEQYSATAHDLNHKKVELAAMMETERDVERLKDLKLRLTTVEAERYEVLEDLRGLIGYVKEREEWRKRRR